MIELEIGLRINNARRTVLARVTNLVKQQVRRRLEASTLMLSTGHWLLANVSQVLRDSTPRIVSLSVSPSATL